MEAQNINLVVVTSVIYPFLPSLYNAQERFEQLITLTIPSIQKKIPNAYLVIVEGSSLSTDQKNTLKKLGVHELLHIDIKNYEKSYGEATLLVKYFESKYFKNLIQNKNVLSINKISGRYYLNNEYNFNCCSLNKVLIKKHEKSTWTNKGICDTRYYRFPLSSYQRYYNILKKILSEGIFIDLEHSFYHYEIFEFDKIENVDKIHLSGNLAPDGQFISD
jgi:hypothetical protein